MRFQLVKATSKGDQPPEYMRDVDIQGIFAYYFNWHPDEQSATIEQVKKWYRDERGWEWEPR